MRTSKLGNMAQAVPHLSFGFVFAMPEGLILDVWALPKQERPVEVLAKALVELAIWARISSELLGEKPSVFFLEGGMSLCGGEVDERRFLMLGFSKEASPRLVRACTLHMVDGMRSS